MASRSTANPLFVPSTNPKLGQMAGSFLDNILTPDPNQMIGADLDSKRRDLLLSQTSGQNLKNDELSRFNTSTTDLQAFIDSGVDLNDPKNRAHMLSLSTGMRNGLQYAPKYTAGATGVLNPNADDLSTILTSGGVQTFQSTPEGQQNALDAAMARTVYAQDQANARSKYAVDNRATSGSAKANVVSPTDYNNIWKSVALQLSQANPQAVDPETQMLRLDPGVQQAIMDEATRQYLATHNTSAAISSAMAKFPLQAYTPGDSWFDGEWAGDPTLRMQNPTTPAPAPAPGAPGMLPQPTAAPPFTTPPVTIGDKYAAMYDPAKAQARTRDDNVPGVYKRHKTTGDVYQKTKDGQWVLVQKGAASAPAQ
jgi:hypothetical protein